MRLAKAYIETTYFPIVLRLIDWIELTVQLPRDLTLQMGNALMAFKLDGQAL